MGVGLSWVNKLLFEFLKLKKIEIKIIQGLVSWVRLSVPLKDALRKAEPKLDYKINTEINDKYFLAKIILKIFQSSSLVPDRGRRLNFSYLHLQAAAHYSTQRNRIGGVIPLMVELLGNESTEVNYGEERISLVKYMAMHFKIRYKAVQLLSESKIISHAFL